MQVKKFEAPTIQEALETIKRELGPEAVILQTKTFKKGFGLMNKASVEVTVAVSDRSLQKKQYVESRMPNDNREAISKLPANRQADVIDKYTERHIERAAAQREQAQLASRMRAGVSPSAYAQQSKPQAQPAAQPRRPAQAQAQAQYQAGAGGGMEVATPAPSRPNHKVTATRYIDIDEAPKPQASMPLPAAPAKQARPGAAADGSVEDEVRHLKRMIEELKNNQDRGDSGAQAMPGADAGLSPALRDAFEQLVLGGVERRYAFNLTRKAGFDLGAERANDPNAVMDALADEIMSTSEVAAPFSSIKPDWQSGPQIVALVGPTGVGKTTTVAKLASEAILKRNLKVGLINLDSYKVAAFDQLGTYAKILNVPFRSATNGDELRAAIQDFRSLDLVLIDTTGRSQRDPNALKEMQLLLDNVPSIKTQMVLSAVTRDADLYDMANRFALFKPQGVIISKLDEATSYGAIYNLGQRTKLPMLYFTTGQRVPEDIEESSRERIAALILNL